MGSAPVGADDVAVSGSAPPRAALGRRARLTIVGVVILGVGFGAFFVGRATVRTRRSAATTCSTTFPVIDPVSGRSPVALPSGGTGWFVVCDEENASTAAFRDHRLAHPVNIYDAKRVGHVVAWWYPDCDLDAGIVSPGRPHPQCESSATSATRP